MDKYFKYPKGLIINTLNRENENKENQKNYKNQSTSKGKYKTIQQTIPIYNINQNFSSRNTFIPQNKTVQNKINPKLIEQTTKINYDSHYEKNTININDILSNEIKKPLTLDILEYPINNFENGKCSSKQMGIIQAYGANTHEGIVRNYNEDRVSIIINMNRPLNYKKNRWPKVSFFGIYDGHGGKQCSEYLRDNLHKFISNDISFPENIPQAIKNGFLYAEKDFLNNYALSKDSECIIDKSGSCAIILLIVDNKIYIANCGDSRAIMSINNELREITIDHKPNFPNEKKRIYENGGQVYQSQTPINSNNNNNNINNNEQYLIGPYRVFPGRLSVSRTIGDVEAKNVNFGGNPNVIIAEPDIYIYDLNKENIDFFIMGCDGIFDQLSNKDVFDCAWMIFNNSHQIIKEYNNVHTQCGKIVDFILKSAMVRKSFDNITCLIIAFKNFDKMEKNNSQSEIIPQKVTSIPLSNITKNINNINIKKNLDDYKRINVNRINLNNKLETSRLKQNQILSYETIQTKQNENNKDNLLYNKYIQDQQSKLIPNSSSNHKRPILINVSSQNVMPINISYQSFNDKVEVSKNQQRRNSDAVIHSAKTPNRYNNNSIRNNSTTKYEISSTNPSINFNGHYSKDIQSSRSFLLNTNPNKDIPRKSSIEKDHNNSYNIYIPRAKHNKFTSFTKKKKELELNSNIIGNNNNNINSNFSLRKGIDVRQNNNNNFKNNEGINNYYTIGRNYNGNSNLTNSNSQRYITTNGIRYNFHF